MNSPWKKLQYFTADEGMMEAMNRYLQLLGAGASSKEMAAPGLSCPPSNEELWQSMMVYLTKLRQ
jgi:hypothetical protein